MNAQQASSNKQTLSSQQQSIVAIAALTAAGDLDRLKTQLGTGLDAGLTVNEIKELLVHLYAYCGFPRSLNGLGTFMAVLDERKARGTQDSQGKAFRSTNRQSDKYERGRKTLEKLSKTPQPKPAPGFGEFAPRIDAFLKEHLFADVFDSNVLTHQQRELVTISALAAMPGVIAQLETHVKIGLNTGLTENQLTDVAGLIETVVSRTQANTLRTVLAKPPVPVMEPDRMVRIAELEIVPDYLDEYKAILKEESAKSVQLEPGVIAIFPMFEKERPTQIRLVEIYASQAAYQAHLKTPHFQHYKTGTMKMVKSLKLIDMDSLDPASMLDVFKKLK
ncbi:carboxymuconolactone decarboxylase family protein [Fibrella forsythiae]|uniref:Carboxymuconolactone decarboxylase family protein n=1 Tax=Fibrella forsythiae TaxID=2817061 RepID=A0ABS3JEJ7_9BACT|nr:carboxymuconolactone decarboxylase family protein [Fibrella forsythiae]MBO0948423.1 carboxymuconolactone decarboxylase family protein [Fibrella forsythiae]